MQTLGGMTMQNATDAWREALFASGLQRSDAPTAEMVAEAIRRAMRQFGIRGCVSRMAQEFGDHPDAAAERMRWIRQLAAEVPPLAADDGRPWAGRQQRRDQIEMVSNHQGVAAGQGAQLDRHHKPSGGPQHERDM